ncbi:MAG: TonB-dependent receptor [Bacteroidales bacterium]|nr:TonB-dependent receptor [Bacteroidales bacterium]
MLKWVILFAFLSLSFLSFSQDKIIRGIVSDRTTGENLSGASIYVIETAHGTYSDDDGSYSLSIPPEGNYTVQFSYVGYIKQEIKITEDSPLLLNVQLRSNTDLQEIVISARQNDENITTLSMGLEKLSIEEIRLMPALMGEVDIIKAIQLLPGVQAASEGGSGYSVRGGSPDQNLIVLDNTTVYNPSHLMGFFSVFNNDVISGIELYKGDMPFKFGGRLSSLLDVRTKSEIPDKFRGTGGIGLISSRIMLEGPIKDKTSWLVGARRSYADLFLKLSSDKDIRNTTMYFYDLNGKLSHRFSEKDKLELNAYYGLDNFGAQPGSFKYGNAAVSLTWNHVFSKRLFGKFSAHYTDYDYGLSSKLDGAKMDWESSITDWMARVDFHQPIHSLWDLSYGVNVTYHEFKPGWVQMEGMDTYSVPGAQAIEQATYLSNDQQLAEKLTLRYGVRFSSFHNTGDISHTYTAFEPGFGGVFQMNGQSSFKANYSRNTQYMQLANNSASGSPLDVWFSASPNVKPQKVDMFSLGYFYNFNDNMYETSAEVYYKNLKNVIDFKEHANLVLNENLEKEIRTGKGEAYGIELMVKKNRGKLTGFVNYTLSRSERTIPEINNGKTYLAPYDKTHAINILASYNFSKKWNFSATWIFATGNPTTYPTGRFEIGGEYFPLYSGRNEYRKPNYDRLDISVNYIPNPESKKRWKGEWNFSIYNVYNRKNPWTITYKQDEIHEAPYAEKLYLFGIVPSITYNIKF